MQTSRLLLVAAAAALASAASAQNIRTTGKINETYATLCASCHGKNLEGAQAPSMLDDVWTAGGDDESLFKSIKNGFPEKGMPPWGAMVPEKEIRAMVIYIHEQRTLHQRTKAAATKPPETFTAKSKHHSFRVDTWIDGTIEPFGLAFLSADRAIVTEKRGYAYLVEKGKLAPRPILGVPVVDNVGQAGLYDVVPHPDFAKNGWLYLAFSDLQKNSRGETVSMTRVVRGKLTKEGAFTDQETIYQAPAELYLKSGGVHFGGRIAFDGKGYLYLSIGERGQRDHAQETNRPNGKVHRLHDDGRVPADNPFAKDAKALASLWSYGHRNPQGLAIHPVTGQLFDAEHGPRGGDELNLVVKGKNYGWPVITHGMEYDGKATTEVTHKAGMEQPLTYWVPSIAPCGMNFYTGDKFPKWQNHLFLTSLAGQQLVRLEIQGGKVVDQEIVFRDIGRIRHVIGGPDGALYVLLPTRIARITPAQ